jgi:hypothetical protein
VAGVTLNQVLYQDNDNVLGAVVAIGGTLAPQIIVITASTVVIVEGYAMFAEKYHKGATGKAARTAERKAEQRA